MNFKPYTNDLTGMRFGRWFVKSYYGKSKDNATRWLCVCEPDGVERIVLGQNLRNGSSTSCGCYCRELKRQIKHGMVKSPEYAVWRAMKARCLNPTDPRYCRYGARGITVCERWQGTDGFQNFINDIGLRPGVGRGKNGLSIERVDNNGNYEPNNCKWATWEEQANNQRKNHLLTLNGVSKSISQWAHFLGFPVGLIFSRLRLGWGVEDILTIPPMIRGPRKQ